MGLKFRLTDKELVLKYGNDVSYFESVGKPPISYTKCYDMCRLKTKTNLQFTNIFRT